jgi:hypothetical protein
MKYKSLKVLKEKFSAEYRVKEQMIYGNYRGYGFYLKLNDQNFTHTLILNAKGNEVELLKKKLKEIAANYENIKEFNYENGRVMVHFLPYVEEEKTISSIEVATDNLINVLSEHEFINASDFENDIHDEIELFETNKKEKIFISEAYAEKLNEEVYNEYLDYINKPYRKWLAILLSIIFTVPGVLLWILLYDNRVQYCGLIGGALIMLCGFLGYYLVAKKSTNKILIYLSVLSFIVILIGQFFAFNNFVYNLTSRYYEIDHFFAVFEYYPIILNINYALGDLIFSFSGAIIGATVALTLLLRNVYVRRVNAYGAIKVTSDEDEYEDNEDEDENKEDKEEPLDV